MDARPTRKPSSLRSIAKQTSKQRVIVVEADDDKAVYEAILDKALGLANFIIYSPIDLGAKVDGKTGVLSVHDELIQDPSSNPDELAKIYFILDKDVDDILGRLNSSERIVYTTGYNIESDLFATCALERVVSVCLMRQISTISSYDLDSDERRRSIDSRWRDWLIACIYVRMHMNDDAPKAYSLKSQIHNDNGTLNPTKLSNWKTLLRAKSRKSEEGAEKAWAMLESAVNRWVNSKRGPRLINGKWYPQLLTLELRSLGILKKSEGINDRLWIAILAFLSDQCPLVALYRSKLRIT